VRDPGPGRSSGSAAPFDFADIPHGKQSWYGPLGGIWQDVYLEATAPAYIKGAGVNSDPSTGGLRIEVSVDGSTPQEQAIVCDVEAPDGTPALRRSVMAPAAEGSSLLQAAVDEVTAWEPDYPALYRLRLRLASEAGISDEWTDEFGFRSIRTERGRILLNDRPLYLRGALDQDYYDGTLCVSPSDDLLGLQIMRAKEMSLNLLRCHLKVPDPRYLRWADRLGILVWLELPNWQRLTPAARRRALATLTGMIERDRNHPSVIAWTIVNESSGQRDGPDPARRRQLGLHVELSHHVRPK
jgi:beta-galactosidase/beta-glucuronidase